MGDGVFMEAWVINPWNLECKAVNNKTLPKSHFSKCQVQSNFQARCLPRFISRNHHTCELQISNCGKILGFH